MKNIHIYIGILFLLVGCKKEIGPQGELDQKPMGNNLIVINEGNFGFGNASVSLLNPETGEIANNQYRAVNGVGIGDVLQSVNRYQDKLYFVVNNSGKVVVTDTNLKLITEITGFNSPRYIAFYQNKAFVTDLKQEAVYVVDLMNNQITNQIPTQGWTEQVELIGNKLYVLDRGDYLSNADSNFIFIIDSDLEIKVDSIKVGVNPNSMVVDQENNLWVLTSGNSTSEKSNLIKINTDSKEIDFQHLFSDGSHTPSRLSYNSNVNELYYINNSVYNTPADTTLFSPALFYPNTSQNFYGISVHKDKLFVFDAKNFNQKGEILEVNEQGKLLNRFEAGIIPQSLL